MTITRLPTIPDLSSNAMKWALCSHGVVNVPLPNSYHLYQKQQREQSLKESRV